MKCIPMLFKPEMVKALLEGRKTQTRRLTGLDIINKNPGEYQFRGWTGADCLFGVFYNTKTKTVCKVKNPYGPPGDRLWVKETHTFIDICRGYDNGGNENGDRVLEFDRVVVKYSDGTVKVFCEFGEEDLNPNVKAGKKRPSIFMPRWASRISREITSVRAERLQEISIDDAIAEGITEYLSDFTNDARTEQECDEWRNRTTIENFKWLWESINGRGSWDKNPWLLVFNLEKITTF